MTALPMTALTRLAPAPTDVKTPRRRPILAPEGHPAVRPVAAAHLTYIRGILGILSVPAASDGRPEPWWAAGVMVASWRSPARPRSRCARWSRPGDRGRVTVTQWESAYSGMICCWIPGPRQ